VGEPDQAAGEVVVGIERRGRADDRLERVERHRETREEAEREEDQAALDVLRADHEASFRRPRIVAT
jgi:hypothetical protein